MKNQRLKPTATKALLFAALLGFASLSWAQVVGTIAHLSGPLVAKKANGTVKVLAVKSDVENGDTLVAEKNTYAQIRFVDNGEITLRPNTVFKIENYSYNAEKPEGDAEHLELIKGGLRSVTGLLGKRNKEKFALKTPTATIGIRGTTFIATYVPPSSPNANQMRINPGSSLETPAGNGKTPAAHGIPINPNPSVLETYDPGKLAQPGAGMGTINRGPDGGDPSMILTGGTQPAANAGSQPNQTPPAGPVPGTGANSAMAGQLQTLINSGSLAPPQMPPIPPMPLTPPAGGNMQPGPAPLGQAGLGLAPGLHLQVTDGAIVVTNNGGSLGFQAGQFGFVPNVNQPPVLVPSNPGIQFVPPPSFNTGSGGPTASNGPGQGQATDCIVR